MNSREFEYILAIAEEKSLSRAAERLFITQPALSLFLSRFEEQLKVQLFTRTPKGMVPTYVGEQYLSYAKRAMALEHSFDQELCSIQKERKGRLRIGTSPHIGSLVLPSTLSEFQQLYENIEVSLKEGTSHELESLLENGSVDLVLTHLPLFNRNLAYTPIMKDPYVMVLSGDHPLNACLYTKESGNTPYIDVRNAANEDFILAFPNQRVRQIQDRILERAGITPKIRFETSSVQTSLRFASFGLGVTFMPESYIPLFNRRRHTVFCYLEDKYEANWVFSLVYLDREGLSTPAQTFIDITKRHFGNINV